MKNRKRGRKKEEFSCFIWFNGTLIRITRIKKSVSLDDASHEIYLPTMKKKIKLKIKALLRELLATVRLLYSLRCGIKPIQVQSYLSS